MYFIIDQDPNGNFHFFIKSPDHETLAMSKVFRSKQAALTTVNKMMAAKICPNSKIEDLTHTA